MADTQRITYRLSFADGAHHEVAVELDARSLALRNRPPAEPPEWTELGCEQCSNCPLAEDQHPYCPLALSLVDLVQLCKDVASYEEMEVEVETPERTTRASTTVQRGVASLMGLVIATSGCPHTTFFRPMARFHLPLASEEETIYRATSTYLLAQYFRRRRGAPFDLDLQGLVDAYRRIHVVNTHVAKRLWQAVNKDSSLNALILLDLFSKAMPDTIEDSLEEIRYLFEPFLESQTTLPG